MQASLVLSHEFGHNFGTGHDAAAGGSSTTELGSFLMCPAAVVGDKANHHMFSANSINAISSVMRDRAGCFERQAERSSTSNQMCGNFQREGTEDCDCGGGAGVCPSVDMCCTEQCTFNQVGGVLAVCSPNNQDHGACCSSDCTLLATNTTCREQSECMAEAVCTADGKCPLETGVDAGSSGSSGSGANAAFRPANSLCERGVARCSVDDDNGAGCAGLCNAHGDCSGSICELWNQTVCPPTPGEAACKVTCRAKGATQELEAEFVRVFEIGGLAAQRQSNLLCTAPRDLRVPFATVGNTSGSIVAYDANGAPASAAALLVHYRAAGSQCAFVRDTI